MEELDWLRSYILSNSSANSDDKYVLYAGMHVNVSPMPEDCFGYMPMQYVFAPAVYGMSLPVSYAAGIPVCDQRSSLWGINPTFLLRLGNAIFYCVLWHPEKNSAEKQKRRELAHSVLPFVKISSQHSLHILKRVTADSNISKGYGHILTVNALAGEDSYMSSLFAGKSVSEMRSSFENLISIDHLRTTQKLIEDELLSKRKE